MGNLQIFVCFVNLLILLWLTCKCSCMLLSINNGLRQVVPGCAFEKNQSLQHVFHFDKAWSMLEHFIFFTWHFDWNHMQQQTILVTFSIILYLKSTLLVLPIPHMQYNSRGPRDLMTMKKSGNLYRYSSLIENTSCY